MPQKLNTYTLGQLGVNRTKSPLHIQDGELLVSQNAHPTVIQGRSALRKRDGFVKINSIAAAGQILAIGNIPFRDPGVNPEFGAILVTVGNLICATSVDAVTWTSRTVPAVAWTDVCWAPELNLFCAVGSTSGTANVMTSPDGITWTSRTTPSSAGWKHITWSPQLELFAAIGVNSVDNTKSIMTSPDGITWTLRDTGTSQTWENIAWSPHLGIFVGTEAGSPNQIIISADGITWTQASGVSSEFWFGITWSPQLGIFCVCTAFGSTGDILTSINGTTWTDRTPSASNVQYRGVAWSPDLSLFAVVGTSASGAQADRIMTSPDGISWTSRGAPEDVTYFDVTWNGILGLFVASGPGVSSADHIAYSSDGITWNAATANIGSGSWSGVV